MFAPIAIAAIGVLSLPLMNRSIVIRMQRNDRWHELRRFDFNNTGDLDRVYVQVRDWARHVKLNADPQLPPELIDRLADNWRPLIAIADSFGPEWGRIARLTAVHFAKDWREEDVPVLLLHSIREVFDALGVDRITGKALLEALHRLEEAGWSEFTGVKGDRPPRKLRNSELRAMLRMFGIESRVVWPAKGVPGDRSGHGYYRSDFEAAWRAYCEGGETVKPSNVIPMRLQDDKQNR